MPCVQLAGVTLSAAMMGLGILLVGVAFYQAARGMAVMPAVRTTLFAYFFVLIPALLVVAVLDDFKIDLLPGRCGAPSAP